ncbi:hypothetical protein K7P01_06195 [Fulvivirgaceae bacterium QH1ED-6-2]|nr:hypothetical protein [Parachryseolinea silvisoli]
MLELASKNVIDIQVTVSYLQAPVRQQMEEAGFIFHTGIARDRNLLSSPVQQ